jgi:hypothetical protein
MHYPDPTNQDALPESVKVTDAGEQVLLRAAVTEGYQIYECKASTSAPGGFAWQFQAPFAFLKADDGANVLHSTGPVWLYTQDGSEIMAKIGQFTNPDGSVVLPVSPQTPVLFHGYASMSQFIWETLASSARLIKSSACILEKE